jgi:hypothetical protein
VIWVDGKIYRATRLAWLYMTGKWPKLEIGYINRKTSDTRWVVGATAPAPELHKVYYYHRHARRYYRRAYRRGYYRRY